MGVASVELTEVANRAGAHDSAVRRYFISPKEVLLHLAAEGRVQSSERVCKGVARARSDVTVACRRDFRQRSGRRHALLRVARQPSPALEHEIDLDTVVETVRTSSAAMISLRAAIEQRCRRRSALRTRRPSCRLSIGGPPCGGSSTHRRV